MFQNLFLINSCMFDSLWKSSRARPGSLGHERRRGKLAVLPPIEFEISEEVQGKADILDPMVRRKLEAWIRAGVVKFVHFGTPCTSFSIARRHDGGPPPVRDADNLYGFEDLRGYDLELVRVHALCRSPSSLPVYAHNWASNGLLKTKRPV